MSKEKRLSPRKSFTSTVGWKDPEISTISEQKFSKTSRLRSNERRTASECGNSSLSTLHRGRVGGCKLDVFLVFIRSCGEFNGGYRACRHNRVSRECGNGNGKVKNDFVGRQARRPLYRNFPRHQRDCTVNRRSLSSTCLASCRRRPDSRLVLCTRFTLASSSSWLLARHPVRSANRSTAVLVNVAQSRVEQRFACDRLVCNMVPTRLRHWPGMSRY